LAVAYIWSSEEATSVADARERALTKAEEALGRIYNGLGGRYYKTRKQLDTKVAQILTGKVAGLITVTTGTRAGKPVITWRRDENAIAAAATLDGLYGLATNLPDPKGGRLDALEVLRIYKDSSGSSSSAIATSNRPSGSDRSSCTTTTNRGPHRGHRHRAGHLRADRSRAARLPR